jgi:REP element-mobilizing transposase RayT
LARAEREAIFADDEDRLTFGEACQKTRWQMHAYCLMNNHFHLMIEPPQPNLVVGTKWRLGAYTSRVQSPAPAILSEAHATKPLSMRCRGKSR